MYSRLFLQCLGNKDQLETIRKIVYLSYHYEPDLSAGSFRNSAVAKALALKMEGKAEIHLFCTQPNRYKNTSDPCKGLEQVGNLTIHRIAVPQHGNGFLLQMWSFWHFHKRVKQELNGLNIDYLYASSSKLFTAYLAYHIAIKKKLKYTIDLRDLFAENIKELITWPIINTLISWIVRKFFERPCLEHASQIIVNSEAFIDSIPKTYKNELFFFPNGIDPEFVHWRQNEHLASSPIIVCYAGNIGAGQGLHKIIPQLAEKLRTNHQFIIIGDGSARRKLLSEIKHRNLKNVHCLLPMRRQQVLEHYKNSHYLLLHLNDFKSFEKVLPSKVFEYGGGNIPILAGVAGYAKQFIEKELKESAFVFKPCDVESVYAYLINDKYATGDRNEFIEQYSRQVLTERMVDCISSHIIKQWHQKK